MFASANYISMVITNESRFRQEPKISEGMCPKAYSKINGRVRIEASAPERMPWTTFVQLTKCTLAKSFYNENKLLQTVSRVCAELEDGRVWPVFKNKIQKQHFIASNFITNLWYFLHPIVVMAGIIQFLNEYISNM